MRKLLTSVLLLVLALVIASPALAQSSTVTLWADNSNINAGNVTVSIDGDNLVITYQTTDGGPVNRCVKMVRQQRAPPPD
jgi:hypothetical protein